MRDGPSTRDLLGEFSNRLTQVVSLQLRLARAEIGEAASKAGVGAALVGTGVIFLLAGLFVLLLAIVALLDRLGMAPDLSYLIVGVVAVVVAVMLILLGMRQVRTEALSLPRSRRQLVELGHVTGTKQP